MKSFLFWDPSGKHFTNRLKLFVMNKLFNISKKMLLKYSQIFGEINCGILKQQNTEECVIKDYLISWETIYAIY